MALAHPQTVRPLPQRARIPLRQQFVLPAGCPFSHARQFLFELAQPRRKARETELTHQRAEHLHRVLQIFSLGDFRVPEPYPHGLEAGQRRSCRGFFWRTEQGVHLPAHRAGNGVVAAERQVAVIVEALAARHAVRALGRDFRRTLGEQRLRVAFGRAPDLLIDTGRRARERQVVGERLLEVARRLLVFPLLPQRRSQVEMGESVVWTQADVLFECQRGIRRPAFRRRRMASLHGGLKCGALLPRDAGHVV